MICFHSNIGIMPFLSFVFSFQLQIVEAPPEFGVSPFGPALVFCAFFFVGLIIIMSCHCYNKHKQEESQRHPVHYVNDSNVGAQVVLNGDEIAPPPSYFQVESQCLTSHHTQVTTDQPPPYSAHVKLYHTRASGQPMVSGNLMQGLDNPAFLNRNISNFSNLPNLADDLPVSSRSSIPCCNCGRGI